MKKFLFTYLFSALMLVSCSYKHRLTATNIRLDPVFSSGMILQNDSLVQISGYASPEGILVVRIKDFIRYVHTDEKGRWYTQFPAIQYNHPFSLTVEGQDSLITLKNILAGKVYLIAGNAALSPLEAYEPAACKPKIPKSKLLIRVFQAEESEGKSLKGKWYPVEELAPNQLNCVAVKTIRDNLEQHEGVIGIINLLRPGSRMQTWLPPDSPAQPKMDTLSAFYEKQGRFLLTNPTLLDTIILLKDSSRVALETRTQRIWYDDEGWRTTSLPVNLADKLEGTSKKLVYLRKKIYIAPRWVNSDFTIDAGWYHGDTWFYFNETAITPVPGPGGLKLHIPDSLINTYTNLLFVRMFAEDSLAGIYGEKFLCYNQDSSYFETIGTDWKYNFRLEPDFPPYIADYTLPGALYQSLLSPAGDLRVETVFWYDDYREEVSTLWYLPEILQAFNPSSHKKMVYREFTPVDSILYPDLVNELPEILDSITKNNRAEWLVNPADLMNK